MTDATFGTPDVALGNDLLTGMIERQPVSEDAQRQVAFYMSVFDRPIYRKSDLIGGCFIPFDAKPIAYVNEITGERREVEP